MAIVKTTADLALTVEHDGDTILVDASSAAVALTLPSALMVDTIFIRKTDSTDNAVTLQTGHPDDTIEGGTTFTLSEGNSSLTVVSDREGAFYIQGSDKYKVDYRLVTEDGEITASDFIVAVSGAAAEIVVTLPSASVVPAGRQFLVVGEASDTTFTIVLSGAVTAETIDGVVAATLSQETGSLSVYSNGTLWRRLFEENS